MAFVRAISRSSLALILSALIIAGAISFNTLYTARGDSHDQRFYACLFAGALTQVNTTAQPTCGRGAAIEWNAQGIPGEQGPQGDTGEKGDTGEQGEQGPAGVDAPKQIAGLVSSTGERQGASGRGFEAERLEKGYYRVTFPAGTWSAESFPAAVVTPNHPNPTTNLTWVVRHFVLELDGSFQFDVVFDDENGEPFDAGWIFVVTQT